MNLGGGTHRAGFAFARGYCLFNDVALAASELRLDGSIRRVLVVDCDVRQGDGTADLLGPDADAFTLSIHVARNYPFKNVPSDLDVDFPSGTGDDDYLAASVLPSRPHWRQARSTSPSTSRAPIRGGRATASAGCR